MKKKIGVISLGCPKNLVDSEIMLGKLQENYKITSDEKEADIIIINTCGFIESAKQESINTILEMSNYKLGACELLIVTGCMAERYNKLILKQFPDVDAVVGVGSYGKIADIIEETYRLRGKKMPRSLRPLYYGKLDEIEYLESERVISTGKTYAYLKIAEGCDNCCTYCVIPSLRGKYRSRKIENIVNEAERLAQDGIKEVILVAQDTTRYGSDIYGERKLVELIRKISKIEGIEWIRLLYCYPEEITTSLIEEIADNEKVCKYIDIPIQHASDKILKSMGRRGSSEDIRNLILNLRSKIPEIVIRTSLIVGFPGEDESEYQKLYNFVKELKFDRLGVFMYSKEESTPATTFKPQLRKNIKQKRHRVIMSLQKEIVNTKNNNRLGRVYKAIVEGVSEDGIFYYGRTYAEAPEIDGSIYFTSQEPLSVGQIVNIKILNTDEYDLIGDVIHESCE